MRQHLASGARSRRYRFGHTLIKAGSSEHLLIKENGQVKWSLFARAEGAWVAEAEQAQPASTANSSRIGIVIAMAIRNIQRRPLRSSFAGAESRHGQWATLASTKSGIGLMRLQQRLSGVSDQQNRVPRFVISPAIAMRVVNEDPLPPTTKG